MTASVERFDNSFQNLMWAKEIYGKDPHTPELLTRVWQIVWQNWGLRTGRDFWEIRCDRTQAEIDQLEAAGKSLIILPEEVLDQIHNPYQFLAETFPFANNLRFQIRPASVAVAIPRVGTIAIEASVDAPNLNTGEYQLPQLFEAQGVTGQTLVEYVVGSNFSRLMTSHYFDENGTRSRLTGTRDQGSAGWAIDAHSDKSGQVFINASLDPEDRKPNIGARTSEVKAA